MLPHQSNTINIFKYTNYLQKLAMTPLSPIPCEFSLEQSDSSLLNINRVIIKYEVVFHRRR